MISFARENKAPLTTGSAILLSPKLQCSETCVLKNLFIGRLEAQMRGCLIEWSYLFDDYNDLRLLKDKDHIKSRNVNMRKISLEMWKELSLKLSVFYFFRHVFIMVAMILCIENNLSLQKRNSRACFFSWFSLWWNQWKTETLAILSKHKFIFPLDISGDKRSRRQNIGLGLMVL